MKPLAPDERKLEGKWETINGALVPDSVSKRIEELIADALIEISTSGDGWTILYQDKNDGRYWELSYPQSEVHGGGPPMIEFISPREAEIKYEIRKEK